MTPFTEARSPITNVDESRNASDVPDAFWGGVITRTPFSGVTLDPATVEVVTLEELMVHLRNNFGTPLYFQFETSPGSLTVSNTGAGIPPEHIPHLFERFFRADPQPDMPGQGLGLSLARELARAHGGDLELARSDAEWTVFVLRIPAGISSANADCVFAGGR